METAAVTMGDKLISKLQSSTADLTDIHQHFLSYLHPFMAIHNSKTAKKSSKTANPPDAATLRTLAKQFLPFLNKVLSLLPKCLSQSSNRSQIPKQIVLDLFDIYKLCLNSLDLISSQLSCKPYSVHVQRERYIHCLVGRELYREAENEGYSVLDSLRFVEGSGSAIRAAKGKPRYVPQVNEKSVDRDLALLVVEIVVTLVKCAFSIQSKDADDYFKVLLVVDEACPWFRRLDADAGEKMQRQLVAYLTRISFYLVTESKCYPGELTHRFCSTTFREHESCYLKVQMLKFARKLCSYVFSQEDNQNPNIIDMLKLVLDSMAAECKVGVENTADFLELVSYCANKCCSRSNSLCNDVIKHLRYLSSKLCEVKGEFSQVFSFTSSVVGIYATGLSFATVCAPWGNADGRSALSFFLEKEDIFLMLNGSLLCVKSYLKVGGGVKFSPDGNSLFLPCLEALKFVCQPLAEFICSEKKVGLDESDNSPVSPIFHTILEAFDQLCSIFLRHRSAEKKEKDVDKAILRVGVAAVTLSCRIKREVKASLSFLEGIISASWTQPQGLKYIFGSLYNNAVILYRAKRMLEASRVLEISCRASWKCVAVICQFIAGGGSECEDGMSREAASDLCVEACAKSAFLLDLLCQESPSEVDRVMKDSLERWSAAKTLLEELPSPIALVRQWVKIQCGYLKDEVEQHDRAGNLYYLLCTSERMSERLLGFLIEQELIAYKEAIGRNRRICRKTRMELMNILLGVFYNSKDRPIEKSRILIERGSEIRSNGEKDSEESVQCLSEAIATLSAITGDKFSCESNDLLAYAYCLRECWAQEVENEPEQQLFQDLHAGVDLCLRPRCCHPAESCHRMPGNLLNMLYHMFDLLSIKGFTDLHIDIYKIMVRLFNLKKVPVGKLLAVLWKSRRLSHPLCPSPIDLKFIAEFCKNHDDLNKPRYWIKYMEESQPLIVGFEQSFLSINVVSPPSSYHHDSAIHSDLTEEKIKQAASSLISSIPQSDECIFMAAYLYYDLCERLIQSGHMIEALFYAKEAHRLRTRLLQEQFIYSIEEQEEIYDETGELIQKCSYKVKTFDVRNSASTEAWFCAGMSCDIEGFVLTPWNTLQCYLESTLQEGTILEIIGNRHEAETLLLWGKSISCLKSLPMFVVSFSTILGKLYRKQRLWNLADKELKGARGILTQISGTISCMWCKSVLEATISEQLGDLNRHRCCNDAEHLSFARLSNAIDIYRSVLTNLSSDQSETTVNSPGLASTEIIKAKCDSVLSDQGQKAEAFPPKGCRVKAERVSARQSKAKKENKNLKQVEVHKIRKTRSRDHNFLNSDGSLPSDKSVDLALGSNAVDFPACSESRSKSDLETKCSVADILFEVTHLSDQLKCLHCLLLDIHSSSSLSKLVCIRWELARRRLLLRSLISIAKCLRDCGNIHEAREVLLQSLLLLINRNTCIQYSSCPVTTLFDLIGEGYPRNLLTIEGASLLYHICWMSLKGCHCNNSSQFCSELSSIEQSRIISWLRMVFMLCQEVPIIFQKVSRLLAALYIIYSSINPSALPCGSLSISHWASFFHQAAIGIHHNQELNSRMTQSGKCEGLKEVEKSNVRRSIASVLGEPKKSSLASLSEKEFDEVVSSFFRDLPSIRVICISCIVGVDGDLLRELMCYDSSVKAWLLLSRLNSDNQPISILLPANSLVKETSYDGNSSSFIHKSAVKKWRCPWTSTLVNDVAPTFKLILEESHAVSSVELDGNTKRNKLAWWAKRKELDERLGDFLHNMEQSWLGPLKYLLSDEWPDFRDLDSLQKKVLDELGYDCVLQTILNGGCYVHKPSNILTEVESAFSSFFKTLSDSTEPEEFGCIRTKPVMLVLDYEVQMLPWESLPILKSQEVYRMPSLYSISITLDTPAIFPWIDPLDSYYVLNPGGDLTYSQVEFENWYKDQHFQGKAGTAPTIEELSEALKSRDLFIYIGHGSGAQYFPLRDIKKLDKCSGTVLMGCSSGTLSLDGSYAPEGMPLNYLLAGSPLVIANLWDVTDKDIDRFFKAMLESWLEVRASVSKSIDECDDDTITEEMKSLSMSRTRGDRRKGRSRKKSDEKHAGRDSNHRPKLGAFIGQAREACVLPFLIGAAPVCYGVPTGITRKNKL